MNKNTTHIRAFMDSKKRLDEIARELSVIQQDDIKTPEVLRRALNIPSLKDILKRDAELKRGMSR